MWGAVKHALRERERERDKRERGKSDRGGLIEDFSIVSPSLWSYRRPIKTRTPLSRSKKSSCFEEGVVEWQGLDRAHEKSVSCTSYLSLLCLSISPLSIYLHYLSIHIPIRIWRDRRLPTPLYAHSSRSLSPSRWTAYLDFLETAKLYLSIYLPTAKASWRTWRLV